MTVADWTHDPSYLQTQHAIHNLWSTPRMTTNLHPALRVHATRFANAIEDAAHGNLVNTVASNEYWHGRGQHNNGAITLCAGCVADDNTRGLNADQRGLREATIARYAERAVDLEQAINNATEAIDAALSSATENALDNHEGVETEAKADAAIEAIDRVVAHEVRRTLGWL